MTKDEIIFFLSYGLEWLVPCAYAKQVEEVKKELGL